MPKLRHLAILTRQPEKLAQFDKYVFEMKELFRTKNGSVRSSEGEVTRRSFTNERRSRGA